MSRCKCGSYAINIHHHGRDGVSDLDLCDVCYWRKRAGGMIGQGSPSGVAEAAMKVFGDFTYEALRHHKERSTKVKEFHAATNLIWDALRALPQAPPKEARETQLFTREVCPECKNSDVADCLGALPCPHCSGGYVYTEVRDGDTEEPAKRCDQCGRLFAEHATGPENGSVVCLETYEEIRAELIEERAEVDAFRAKTESLEARATELAQELDDWRNREAACCPEDTPFEDEIKALRAKVESLEDENGFLRQIKDSQASIIRKQLEESPKYNGQLRDAEAKLRALEGAAKKAVEEWGKWSILEDLVPCEGWLDAMDDLEQSLAKLHPTKGMEAGAAKPKEKE